MGKPQAYPDQLHQPHAGGNGDGEILMAKRVSNEMLAQKLDDLTELVKNHVQKDDAQFQKIFYDNGRPSVFSRLNSLEDIEGNRKWHFRAVWTVLLGAITAALFRGN